MTTVTVLFFGALADQLQCRELSLPVESNTMTAQDLRERLQARGGSWQALASDGLRCAINQEIAKMQQTLQPGDEVAFFPPVTGG